MRTVSILQPFLSMMLILSSGFGQMVSAGVREKAIVNLTFDHSGEAANTASPGAVALQDSAVAGTGADTPALPNGGTAISSVFNPAAPGNSLLLDASTKQVLTLASSADTQQTAAVTVSGFFASLHPLSDNSFHGLFAKRQPAAPNKTNYGVNFNPASDSFQVYVNDGSGFKSAVFSVKTAIGARRRTHLAASFETVDAPGADADADVDDLRVRLFVNGVPIAASSVSAGFADGTSAWLQDVKLDACTSDTPLIVGGSHAEGEYTRLICDDICLFSSALSDEDARLLFQETAGSAAEEIIREQSGSGAETARLPVVSRFSPLALTAGQKNHLTIFGSNLQGAVLHLPIPGVNVVTVPANESNKAEFEVTLPKETVPGRYLLRIFTSEGSGRPGLISIDGLPQHLEEQFSESSPAGSFPFAVSGVVSGTEQKRVYFTGKKGQRIAVEVEARRIGSALDPVVEIKTALSAPIAVQWKRPDLAGDARADVTLPADGLYFAEVHDLQFRAPANSPWRLLIGDLPASSLAYPPVLTSASNVLRTVGSEGVSESVTVGTSPGAAKIEAGSPLMAFPALITSTGREVSEPLEGTFDPAPVDATFAAAPFAPLNVNGRISAAGEKDSVLLTVTPKQTLHITVAARSLASPLRPELSVFNGDARIAFSDGDSGSSDPSADVTVPDGVTQLKIQVRDFTERGNAASIYRLHVSRKDRPDFILQTSSDALRIPLNGSAPLKLSIVRQSASFRYTGPVRLSVTGMPGLSLFPNVIPASEQDQEILLVVTRTEVGKTSDTAGQGIAAEGSLAIVGQTEGLESNVTSALKLNLSSLPQDSLTFRETSLPAGSAAAVPAIVTLNSVPPVVLRGIPISVSIRVLPLAEVTEPFVRLEMLTTERTRKADPNNPASASLPMVSAPEFQFGSVSSPSIPLNIDVPADVVQSSIDAIIGAEFVSHPLSGSTGSKAWTAPIRFTVESAVILSGLAEPTKAKKATTASVAGLLRRHPQFSEPVNVVVEGLPAGYSATPVAVASDQTAFTVSIVIPEAASAGEVPNVSVRAQRSNGTSISPPVPLKLVIE